MMTRAQKIAQIRSLLRPEPPTRRLVMVVKEDPGSGLFKEGGSHITEEAKAKTYTQSDLDQLRKHENVIIVKIIPPIHEYEN